MATIANKKKAVGKRPKKTAQSLSNNFGALPVSRYGAEQAHFYLSALKRELGVSQQRLIVELVIAGFEVADISQPVREKIRKAWMDARPVPDPMEQ